ncbi:MAG: translation initiation factor IF-2 [Defluviitaleaceae bacterium]|nr:translation initiation factor IF-2 [Defluviitaleaceae bacterium]
MAKKRIYELAKEIGVGSTDIMKFLPEIDIAAKTHFVALEERDVEKVRQRFASHQKPQSPKGDGDTGEAVDPKELERKRAKRERERERRKRRAAEKLEGTATESVAEGSDEAQPKQERPVRLGPDGKPLPRRERPLGPDGKPLPRPERPLGPDGRPLPRPPRLGPDGKPLPRRERPLGPDGKPLPRPERPLGPDGRPIPRPPRLGPDGKPLPRRERPLGPDGKPLPRPERPLGPDGRPIPRPPRLGPDGKPLPPRPPRLGPDGKPLPRQDRFDRPHGDRPPRPPRLGPDGKPLPHSDRPRGDRPPYRNDNRPGGQQRPGGDRPPFRNDNRPGGQRPGGGGGDRPPFRGGDNRPGGGARPGGFGGADRGRPGGFSKDKNNNQKAQEAPDKHGRRQKLEIGAKKDKRRDRMVDDREGKTTSHKPVVKVVPKSNEPRIIQVPATLTLKELAEMMNKQGAELVKALIKKGDMITINQEISYEKAEEIAIEYNILVEPKIEIDILEEVFSEEAEDDTMLATRPPVVVVMGHVDHGKTSLLDSIRKTDVVVGEAGGITQHIGAYTVSVNERPITFLDTPGHEAFTAMRMRGAQVTDIAVLVVAADDGVMPQTIEAISHARAAGVEIIVAINKIDKPSANPEKVMRELSDHGLTSEAWGGETICVPVSAHTKEGIEQLLEMILLVADMKEYKANPNKKARGTVIEAQLDKGRGPVATVLVQAGTLNIGDPIVAGTAHGRVRAMINDKGQKVETATPSIPVEILGLTSVPTSGDLFHVAQNEKQARYVAETIVAKNRVKLIEETPQKVSLDDLFNQIQAGKVKELNIIIKADVGGSVEAVKASLEKLSNEEVRIRTILGGVGAITESDVMLASASNAIIIGFNVRPEVSAKSVAEEQQVDIRLYRIIYNAIDDIKAAMVGMLDPIYEEKVIGHAQIRQIFKASGIGTIGGAYVTDGKITRNASVRVLRDNIVVYEGTLDTLRRFKDDVREVLTNYECGLVLSKFNDIKENDVVEAFVMEEIKR